MLEKIHMLFLGDALCISLQETSSIKPKVTTKFDKVTCPECIKELKKLKLL